MLLIGDPGNIFFEKGDPGNIIGDKFGLGII